MTQDRFKPQTSMPWIAGLLHAGDPVVALLALALLFAFRSSWASAKADQEDKGLRAHGLSLETSYIFAILDRKPMTAALEEQIKDFAKRTEDSSRELLRGLSQAHMPPKQAFKGKKDLAARMYALRDSLLDGLRQFEAFFWYTLGLTTAGEHHWKGSPGVNAEAAAEIWRQTKQHFLSMRKGWLEAEKMGDPDIDGLVEYTCKVLADLAERSDAQYRSYKETAFVLRSPENAKRLEAALEEARSGKLPVFESIEEALKSLRVK